MYDYIVVGCGFAGATIAERLANDLGKKVLVIDKRDNVAGNMYDYVDENGILIHKYGPHIFHTNIDRVYEYLKQFSEFYFYEHKVLGVVNGKIVPIPFNITSIENSFDSEIATKLINLLKKEYGEDRKIPILELRKHKDKDIRVLADYVYENVFLYYTMKQWGKTPEEIDVNVTGRVPVYVSLDDRYFQDKYQFMPVDGYTKLFLNMLNGSNIDLKLNTDVLDVLEIKDNKIYYDGVEYNGKVIYTGALDELFKYEYGELTYRSLDFKLEIIDDNYYQDVGTVNYPTKEDKFTRITEFKHLMNKNTNNKKTVIMKEYPCQYDRKLNNIPYYPIECNENLKLYNKYYEKVKNIDNLYLIGRLAQYKYFNMDIVIDEALKLYDKLRGEINGKKTK